MKKRKSTGKKKRLTGPKIRKYREQRELTREEFAKKASISPNSLMHVELGHSRADETVAKIKARFKNIA